MNALEPFHPRPVFVLPVIKDQGWYLKRYAILAKGRALDEAVVSAASKEALNRLPRAGALDDETGNQGIGFQIVHFAETAVVSPVFYWQWGSVLAHLDQMRASWDDPTTFREGVREVVGCIWEMKIVQFEVEAWTARLLDGSRPASEGVREYLREHASSKQGV